MNKDNIEEKKNGISWSLAIYTLASAIAGITGTQAINSFSDSSLDTRVAVVEVKQIAMEKAFPDIVQKLEKISKTQDSILIIARMQK